MAKHRVYKSKILAQNVQEQTIEKLAKKKQVIKPKKKWRKNHYISKADRAKLNYTTTKKADVSEVKTVPTTSPKTIERTKRKYKAKQKRLEREKKKLYKNARKKNRALARQRRQEEKAERKARREAKKIDNSTKVNQGRRKRVEEATRPTKREFLPYSTDEEFDIVETETTWDAQDVERDSDNRTTDTLSFDDANDFLSDLYTIVLGIAETSAYRFAYSNYKVIMGIAEMINDIMGYPYETKVRIADEISQSTDYQRVYEILNLVDYDEFIEATDSLADTISAIAQRYL